ncbi:DUF1521 domain-containing protein [Novosphingobium beihaiensis]|uniref:DUF1521 domain-containing protein n=1 Tax=Novosphingobium beihaiensis TaxID=2930389 RepID=A0ABT0BVN1_9SPHN|nr:DUF1521 domain-containing protein [Novosphingobium beihaiensis]MCJ2189067.1 DUF1521 domain-containing protein [Novosphingobium beihaiensis]
MFDLNLNTTINVNVLGGGAFTPADGMFAQTLGNGIMAMFSQPLNAGAFATAQLPSQVSVKGGQMVPTASGQTAFEPAADAQWTASMNGDHQADIDLGDGYTLAINENSSELVIKNANTGESTRIWGDPHVSVDGQHKFDFWGTTTFELENGTKITIGTEQGKNNPNVYYAETLTITKGSQAIVVDGVSQQTKGDLTLSMSDNGYALDMATRDGFVLQENATGSGWRSELSGEVATQQDLNMTKPGQLYGPGSTMASLGEISQALSTFLFFGIVGEMSKSAAEASVAAATSALWQAELA